MVKPTVGSSAPRSINPTTGQNGNHGRLPGLSSTAASSLNAEDLSFVVLQSNSISDGPPSVNGNISNLSSMTSQNSLQISLDVNPEEMHSKLQEVLKENIELKEALQQNNLAMKQQFSTLSTWHEEVLSVHQSHKTKFDEMKSLILKLKTENEGLSKKVQSQPKIDEMESELKGMKNHTHDLEKKMQDYQAVSKENIALKDHIANLEERIASGMTSTEAQEKAERRVRELAEERVQLLRDKHELQQRAALLQEELALVQADGFVVLSTETKKDKQEPAKQLPPPQDKLNSFYATLDKYEERLMSSYKTLESQVDSFSAVYKWLDEARSNLPCSSSSISEMGTLMEMVSLRLREGQKSSTGHRLRLEEASQQLGRLSSDFQAMLQDYLELSNELKKNQSTNIQQPGPSTELQEKVDHLTSQLLEAKEKLTIKEKTIVQSNVTLAKKEAEFAKLSQQKTGGPSTELQEKLDHLTAQIMEMNDLLAQKDKNIEKQAMTVAQKDAKLAQMEAEFAKLSLELQQKTSKPTVELKEELDHMTAQILEMNDLLAQKDKTIEKHAMTVAQKDAKLAQMELRISQAETKANQKETETATAQKKLKNVEQSVDALQAQAEVYKMDFHEERESREKLATEKEKIADELRAAQQENQQLNAELEALKKQTNNQPPTNTSVTPTTSTSRPQPHNYNTIATPGRSRGQWPSSGYEGSSQHDQPKYECPKCQLIFKSLHPLENHVEFCLDQDMYP